MIIAFDYDGCADDKKIQKLMRKLLIEKNEVWVITMRRENEFSKSQIKAAMQNVGLSGYNIIYCNSKPKIEMIEMINADIYIDNQNTEFDNLLNHSNTIPLLFN